jgi:hypothetical protein
VIGSHWKYGEKECNDIDIDDGQDLWPLIDWHGTIQGGSIKTYILRCTHMLSYFPTKMGDAYAATRHHYKV